MTLSPNHDNFQIVMVNSIIIKRISEQQWHDSLITIDLACIFKFNYIQSRNNNDTYRKRNKSTLKDMIHDTNTKRGTNELKAGNFFKEENK